MCNVPFCSICHSVQTNHRLTFFLLSLDLNCLLSLYFLFSARYINRLLPSISCIPRFLLPVFYALGAVPSVIPVSCHRFGLVAAPIYFCWWCVYIHMPVCIYVICLCGSTFSWLPIVAWFSLSSGRRCDCFSEVAGTHGLPVCVVSPVPLCSLIVFSFGARVTRASCWAAIFITFNSFLQKINWEMFVK